MEIQGFIRIERFVRKNILKHNVNPEDIEVFWNRPFVHITLAIPFLIWPTHTPQACASPVAR